MQLFLVQHGASVSKDVDPDCPLNSEGVNAVNRMGQFLQSNKINVAHIYHSVKSRAQQTADILASFLGDITCEQLEGIKPMDDVNAIAKKIPEFKNNTMLVGHLPFMSKLIGQLINGDQDVTTVQFQPGTIICLEKSAEGQWALVFVLRPDFLFAHGGCLPLDR